eukprot:5075353-Heterocapsa_arctica.AAC.1
MCWDDSYKVDTVWQQAWRDIPKSRLVLSTKRHLLAGMTKPARMSLRKVAGVSTSPRPAEDFSGSRHGSRSRA